MAEMVGSAIVQEGMSRAVSLMLGKHFEKTSRGHSAERLEMALSELEFALERTAKLPITEATLLRRRKVLKHGYIEGMDLLNKHKLQGNQDLRQGVKRKRWITYSMNLSVSSYGGLNMDDVRRFEWFADCAGKFIRDVESGCSLRQYTLCNPLVRHLLQGKTLEYEMEQGSEFRYFHLWPICLEQRGVEAQLQYLYVDHKALDKSFVAILLLRLSESTDLVGVAIKCLQSLTSLFNLADETATGELALLANLQDMSQQSYDPPVAGMQYVHPESTQVWRPDPVCCQEEGHRPVRNMVLSERFPEQVILFSFTCSFPALEFSMCSSSDETSTSIMTHRQQPLQVTVAFTPHCMTHKEQESYATEIVGDNEEQPINDVSMQQEAETARSNAINYFLSQPELRVYGRMWRSEHGGAGFVVEKRSFDREGWPITHSWYMNRRSAKKGVRSFR
ncbi:hypothetical protein HU200_027955 [Digitaria exilis]|uniref:Uncharacterized protein n=1 Tax=Digitaria exilis TaxID=1010633 RepID=A0A835BWK5_9POAL|nr:hypothetical protein HU200_027955 [Digitaria exilis]